MSEPSRLSSRALQPLTHRRVFAVAVPAFLSGITEPLLSLADVVIMGQLETQGLQGGVTPIGAESARVSSKILTKGARVCAPQGVGKFVGQMHPECLQANAAFGCDRGFERIRLKGNQVVADAVGIPRRMYGGANR